MMNFINNNLNIVLAVVAVLAIIMKINAVRCFWMLGAESPNPTYRIGVMNKFKIFEVLFATLSSVFIFGAFDLGWLSIIAGIMLAVVIDALMVIVIFASTVINNILYEGSGKLQEDHEKFEKLYAKKDEKENDKFSIN